MAELWYECPKCGSDNLETMMFEGEGETIYKPVYCVECSYDWYELYTFTGNEEKDPSNKYPR
jgi:C4-type Zn-finger protein